MMYRTFENSDMLILCNLRRSHYLPAGHLVSLELLDDLRRVCKIVDFNLGRDLALERELKQFVHLRIRAGRRTSDNKTCSSQHPRPRQGPWVDEPLLAIMMGDMGNMNVGGGKPTHTNTPLFLARSGAC
jgi:hypothetical protein